MFLQYPLYYEGTFRISGTGLTSLYSHKSDLVIPDYSDYEEMSNYQISNIL